MQSKPFLIFFLLSVNYEKFTYKLMDGPITVERLKCCDWSVHKFIEVNFSKITDSNQIFRIDLASIHYHPCEIACQIIECKVFWRIWTASNTWIRRTKNSATYTHIPRYTWKNHKMALLQVLLHHIKNNLSRISRQCHKQKATNR